MSVALTKDVWPAISSLFGLQGRRIKRFVLTLDCHDAPYVEIVEFVETDSMPVEIPKRRFRLVLSDANEAADVPPETASHSAAAPPV